MATKIEKEVLIGQITGDVQAVDFTKMINEQQEFIRQARRMAASKPTRVQEAYIKEQEDKLSQLEDIVKHWIWEAYTQDDNIVQNTMSWRDIEKNFEVQVFVKRRTPK